MRMAKQIKAARGDYIEMTSMVTSEKSTDQMCAHLSNLEIVLLKLKLKG